MCEWIHDVEKEQDIGMGTRYKHGYGIYRWLKLVQENRMGRGKFNEYREL